MSPDGDRRVPGLARARRAAEAAARPEEAFSTPYRLPFQLGLYMAINAIADAYALIDGPDCLYRKAEWIHGKHDLRSTLLDATGRHRVVPTLVNAAAVVTSDGREVVRRMRRLQQLPGVGVAVICSMPHVTIIGTQYDRLISELQPETPFPILEVTGRSLDGDWIDGFADTLEALAQSVDIRGCAPSEERVAVIGYVMDRTEEDHRGNVRELERMLGALGLTLSSVWLSGGAYQELSRAGDAGTLLALPHGRGAARALARRTGARVLDIPAPFGLAATRAMLRQVAAATGRDDAARRFIEEEHARLLPRLEWVIPAFFAGRRVAFVGDSQLWAGFWELATELGMSVDVMATAARAREELAAPDDERTIALHGPPEATLRRVLQRELATGLDLLVGDSLALDGLQVEPAGVVNFGFPCFERHALFDSPFLGFHGWMWLVDAMVNALAGAASREQRARSS